MNCKKQNCRFIAAVLIKANRFNFRKSASPISWKYFGIIVGSVITSFLIFLPNVMLLMAGVMSAGLLFVLFIYDLFKKGLR